VTLSILREIDKDDARRVADGCVLPGEFESAGFAIHLKDGDIIAALIATIEKLACGIKVEAAWIVASCPFLADEAEFAVGANCQRKNWCQFILSTTK
jgi:hypothetical protein